MQSDGSKRVSTLEDEFQELRIPLYDSGSGCPEKPSRGQSVTEGELSFLGE